MPSSTSSGSKPVTTIGTSVPVGERHVFLGSHHRADVAGGEEGVHPAGRGDGIIASIAGGTSTWETSIEKLVDATLAGLDHRHGVGRRGGLEADGEEHDLPVGFVLGDAHRVERRVDDPHVAALAP